MAKRIPRPHEEAGTGAETIPPGATRKALDRPLNPPGGPPGSGAGPRHASGDPGAGVELDEAIDHHREDDPSLTEVPSRSDESAETARGVDAEIGPPDAAYGGPSGGAVGGTPAQGRSTGGQSRRGLSPGGVHRCDSTIGANPKPRSRKGTAKGRKTK